MSFPRSKNPSNPTDILGQPIAEGDRIAYATAYQRGARLNVGTITTLRFLKRDNTKGFGAEVECLPADAEWYSITAKPEVWTGSRCSAGYYDESKPIGSGWVPDPSMARAAAINKVENIIKVV